MGDKNPTKKANPLTNPYTHKDITLKLAMQILPGSASGSVPPYGKGVRAFCQPLQSATGSDTSDVLVCGIQAANKKGDKLNLVQTFRKSSTTDECSVSQALIKAMPTLNVYECPFSAHVAGAFDMVKTQVEKGIYLFWDENDMLTGADGRIIRGKVWARISTRPDAILAFANGACVNGNNRKDGDYIQSGTRGNDFGAIKIKEQVHRFSTSACPDNAVQQILLEKALGAYNDALEMRAAHKEA